MDFSILTYNVLFNKGYLELKKVLEGQKVDVICLQEVDTEDSNLKKIEELGYLLANYSNSFIKFGRIYGVATFYNPQSMSFIDSESIRLSTSFIEQIITSLKSFRDINKPRTVLETRFIHNHSRKKLNICNVHLTVFGLNGIRLKQLKQTLTLKKEDKKSPLIITGDFNYLYGKKKLEKIMTSYGLIEATKNINYTIKYSSDGKNEKYSFFQKLGTKLISRLFSNRVKVDYIFYKNLKPIETRRINIQLSDHFPVLTRFKLE